MVETVARESCGAQQWRGHDQIKPHKLSELWHWRAPKRWRGARRQGLARLWAFSTDLATGICLAVKWP
jgi:hypothetical protein